jgi:hypothetical protein
MVRSVFRIRTPFFYLCIVLLTAGSSIAYAQECPDDVTISTPDTQLNCTGPCPNLTSVLTGGTGPFTYQWYNNSEEIGGATSSWFGACYPGTYYLVVNNNCAPSNSLVIKDRVYPVVAISTPDTRLNCTGIYPNLTSIVTGGGPFTYQWYYNNSEIAGATSCSFIASCPGSYYLKVKNTSSGCENESPHLVIKEKVYPGVAISTPDPQLNCTGVCPKLTSTVTGKGQFEYQWHNSSAAIPNAISSSYIACKPDTYYLEVTDKSTNCTGSSNRLVIKNEVYPVVVITTPDPQLNCTGICPKLTSTVTDGTGPYAYQWYRDDKEIAGAAKSTLSVCSPGTYSLSVTNTSSRCENTSNPLVIKGTSCPGAMPPVQYGQFCEAQKVSGTGIVDLSTSIVDKSIALEYNSAMAGEGDIEMDSEHSYSQNADKLKRNLSSVNGSNESSLNLYGSTKLTYSGAVPLVGGEYLHSKEFYGGMGASIQEMFAVNEMEKDQTTFFTQTLPYEPLNNSAEALQGKLKQAGRDTAKVDRLMRSKEGVYNPSQLVGINTKAAFNGTWGTDAKWHKIFYKDIAAHEMFTGKFEADKLLKFHQYPVPERWRAPCEGIDC